MPTPLTCNHCTFEIPLEWTHCPHCCAGLLFPNVRKANDPEERASLERRFQDACDDSRNRHCDDVVADFGEVIGTARPVLSCTLAKLMPIANRSRDLFATYYDLADLRFLPNPTPGTIDWNTRRPQAEIELLGSHKNIDKLHYALLSIDGESLRHYGNCTVLLKDGMISHRASFLSENSAVFFHKHGGTIPPGHRSDWNARVKLCIAKLAARVSHLTRPAHYPKLLLKADEDGVIPSGANDDFVEIQIFGEMSFHTFEKITIVTTDTSPSVPNQPKRLRTQRGKTEEFAVQDYGENAGVIVELK